MEENEVKEIIHHWEKADPTKKVKLIKQSKGYAWEITYENLDNVELMRQIQLLDSQLREKFKAEE